MTRQECLVRKQLASIADNILYCILSHSILNWINSELGKTEQNQHACSAPYPVCYILPTSSGSNVNGVLENNIYIANFQVSFKWIFKNSITDFWVVCVTVLFDLIDDAIIVNFESYYSWCS